MTDAVNWYDAHAEAVSANYEEATADAIHGWMLDLLPATPATILDVGAGSGRDAAWLAAKGYDVVAVEPSASMMRVRISSRLAAPFASRNASQASEHGRMFA